MFTSGGAPASAVHNSPARAWTRHLVLCLSATLLACAAGVGTTGSPLDPTAPTTETTDPISKIVPEGSGPAVALIPPSGARFVPGQRFDVRVEGKGAGPFSATLALDGEPLAFTSGTQGSFETDGITEAGWGGFGRRGLSLDRPGTYTLSATFTEGKRSTTVTSQIEVVDPATLAGGGRVRNVILILGDGMGAEHRRAARLADLGALAMDGMPGVGTVATRSRDSQVTDSAAGMTAYSIGNRVANGDLGVFAAHVTSPFFAPRVENLASYLHRTRGTSTGIVTTADLTDASPAATAVHAADRGVSTGIADQFLDEAADVAGDSGIGLRVLLGGGRRWMLAAGEPGSSRSNATDSPALPADLAAAWAAEGSGALDPARDLLGDFQRRGFAYVSRAEELVAATAAPPARLLGLFAEGNMTPALDKLAARRASGLAEEPMLAEMTRAALAVLSGSERGFFLMIEGALIDKNSHGGWAERAVVDVLDLDRAIDAALEYASRDGQTLVLVLADHETGGLTVVDDPSAGGATAIGHYAVAADGYPEEILQGTDALPPLATIWTSPGVHTGADVPISAWASDARDWQPFTGPQANEDVFFDVAAVVRAE